MKRFRWRDGGDRMEALVHRVSLMLIGPTVTGSTPKDVPLIVSQS